MEYLVIFLNYNGDELYKTLVKEGESAIYKGSMPNKPNSKFIGWNKSLENVRDDMVVTAVFEKSRTGNLRLGVMSFIENDKTLHVIDEAAITNADLNKDKVRDDDIER